MREAVIIDAVRTPIGKYNGALRSVRPDDLAAIVLKQLLVRNPALDPAMIEEVVLGNANGAGEDNRNVARMSLLLAGLPVETAGTTINRLCGSGLDAVNYAARAILAGEGEVFIAGGTESMTRAPYVMGKPEKEFGRGNMELIDTTIGWRFPNKEIEIKYGIDSMPKTAQNVAEAYSISRELQDEFAYNSQFKAMRAMQANRFKEEIVPVMYDDEKGNRVVIDQDEHPRPGVTIEKLSKLKPLFKDGSITAGNASGINDGASVLLMMSKETAKKLGLKPLARYAGSASAGVHPSIMGIGPVYSTQKALDRAGLDIGDIDLIELNEAFASQSLACIHQLSLDQEKVNVNGGAIALGHPLGASGARILTTLVHELDKRKGRFGLATMCVGVGQGITTLIERYS
ncbi:acetyl-CoA C-acyltransferase [Jeotgalibacillus proteolyticus]|uniref:Acetyl-CoA C-acyltransferase n=1 Tax=Jeotgalibacillus proteolyticus TaxID=2082395 RepID=A0A2S5GH40_9BACL|nr:acetyl-CoA C-acyltransferase [Jeotgalibacillus proteolyticus]PPA72278.1 acetyl-CoA C-acyltransferase [Jeotgalibacillus proteolyticus]